MSARRRRRIKKYVLPTLAIALTLLTAIVSGLFIYAERKLSRLVVGGLGVAFSTKVYAAPYVINDQTYCASQRLILRLKRLGYVRVNQEPRRRGEFFWDAPRLLVSLRGFELPQMSQSAALMTLISKPDNSWAIQNQSGQDWPQIALEPELATELSGAQKIRRVFRYCKTILRTRFTSACPHGKRKIRPSLRCPR